MTDNIEYADGTTGVDHVLRRCKDKKLQGWGDHPDYVIIFTRKGVIYTLFGVYLWNPADQEFTYLQTELL